MDFSKVNFERLTEDVGEALASALAEIVEGAKDDVKTFALDISGDLLHAQLSGNEDLTDQLLDQLKLLAEINRIRVEAKSWALVRMITQAVLKAAVAGAVSVLL